MATRSLPKTTRATTRPAEIGYTDDTAPRIRAYLASMRPLRGSEGDIHYEDSYQRGRSLIERLALSAHDTDSPTLRLSAEQCADVLHFIANSEPLEPATWWRDPKEAPSHVVGFMIIVNALKDSLRSVGKAVRQ
jgi:hypothetical protein